MAQIHVRQAAGVAAVLATVLGMGTAACGTQQASGQETASGPQGSQVAAVRAAFSQAIQAHAGYGSPPAAYAQSALAAAHSGRPVPAFTAAERSQLLASGKAAITRSFAPPQAAAELSALGDAIAVDGKPGIINLGSGASKIIFRNVTVSTASATVTAEVTVWAKSLARQSAAGPWLTAAPVNVMDYTGSLRRTATGTWQVTSLTGTFTPGGGP